jgi:hypothetical protein
VETREIWESSLDRKLIIPYCNVNKVSAREHLETILSSIADVHYQISVPVILIREFFVHIDAIGLKASLDDSQIVSCDLAILNILHKYQTFKCESPDLISSNNGKSQKYKQSRISLRERYHSLGPISPETQLRKSP